MYNGPWWWSSGQRSCLLLQWSEFKSRWQLNLYEKTKIIVNVAWVGHLKKHKMEKWLRTDWHFSAPASRRRCLHHLGRQASAEDGRRDFHSGEDEATDRGPPRQAGQSSGQSGSIVQLFNALFEHEQGLLRRKLPLSLKIKARSF